MTGTWLEIGRVVSVDAAGRSVRVKPAAGYEHECEEQSRIWLQVDQEMPVSARVADVGKAGGLLKLVFTPGMSRDMVAVLGGTRVMIPAEMHTPGPETPVQLRDTVGMRVVVPGGETLGTVMEVIETPAGGVLRLSLAGGRTAALPFIEAVVKDVDARTGMIVINDPEPFLVMNDTAPDACR